MKKRVLVWLLAMTTAASLLSGCGGAAKEAESEAPVEEVPEEVVEEPEPECAHEWVEATFSAPKTCSICGETEGERKLSYFEEHGVEVPDGPAAGVVNVLIFNSDNPEQYQKTTDGTWEQLSCSRMPAEEEGHDLITLELRMTAQPFYDGAKDVVYNGIRMSSGSYDWYTGRMFPGHATENDAAQEYSTVIEVDGKSYDVSFSQERRWEWEGWGELDAEGNAYDTGYLYETNTYKVPKGYDGLVFCIVPTNKYKELDTETVQGTDEDPGYAFDEDYEEGALYFRINREGGMTIEEVQPETK